MAVNIGAGALEEVVYGTNHELAFKLSHTDGTFLTSLTGLAATISIDSAGAGATTNAPAEVGTSGELYLLLTGAELTCGRCVVTVTATNAGATERAFTLVPRRYIELSSGTCQAGSAAGTIVLANSETFVDDELRGAWAVRTNNTPAGAQYDRRLITGYTAATFTATVVPNWDATENPTNASTYSIQVSPEAYAARITDDRLTSLNRSILVLGGGSWQRVAPGATFRLSPIMLSPSDGDIITGASGWACVQKQSTGLFWDDVAGGWHATATLAGIIASTGDQANCRLTLVDQSDGSYRVTWDQAVNDASALESYTINYRLTTDGTQYPGIEFIETAQVDLVDAPNATAVTAIQAGLATAADVTAMEGATFNTATDSLEAIRNRGDAAWTGGGGTSGGDNVVQTAEYVMGTNLVVGAAVIDNAGTAELADGAAQTVGIVVALHSPAGYCQVQWSGVLPEDTLDGLTTGATYYAAAGGTLTTVAGADSQLLGIAESHTQLDMTLTYNA